MNACGCTIHAPHCLPGTQLFAIAVQAFHQLHDAAQTDQEHRRGLWMQYRRAWSQYSDHIDGCQEGDYRIRLMGSSWTIEQRLDGHWIFQCDSTDETSVRTWLSTRGYWRYALPEVFHRHEHLSGFYRLRVVPLKYRHDRVQPSALTQPFYEHAPPLVDPQQQERQTRLAVLVTAHVALADHPFGDVERLRIQRLGIKMLLDSGVPSIGLRDVRYIDTLINLAFSVLQSLRDAKRE